MKKTMMIISVLAMLAVSVAAQQGMRDDSMMPQPKMVDRQQGSNGSAVPTTTRMAGGNITRAQAKAPDISQIREMAQQRVQMRENMMDEMPAARRMAMQNQNEVRMAVHALLAVENFTGGIGPQVAEIARGFNNSVQETIEAEEEIRERGGFSRFLFGGDHQAAERLQEHAQENIQRVETLRQRLQECDECGQEVRDFMQEHIQQVEQEQERLRGLAQAEERSKGLLGWIWK